MFNKLEESIINISDKIYSLAPAKEPSAKVLKNVKLIAHRGIHSKDHLENSLEAFEKAIGHCYGIEFDIRWTKDLEPVVFHDENLKRVFKKDLLIKDLSFEQIKLEHSKIPHLDDVIRLTKGQLHLMVELKNDEVYLDENKLPIMNDKLQKSLEGLTPQEDYHLMSFDHKALNAIEFIPNDAKLPIVNWSMAKGYNLVKKFKYGGVTCHYLLLGKYYKRLFKTHDIKAGVGFIDSVNNLKHQCQSDVEWIFTNEVLKLNEYIQQSTKSN